MDRKTISIVSPCFNEEGNVKNCYEAVKKLFDNELAAYDREHIFCDNASTDKTQEMLREIASADPAVKVIINSRNFGVFRSMFNGTLNASGDAVVPMLAADLQDPPHVMVDFVRLWEDGVDVAYGQRRRRQESVLLRFARKVHYYLVDRLSDMPIPRDAGEFQLIDRKVVEALRQFDDYEPYLRGMIASCGFRSAGVPYDWGVREHGHSKTKLYDMITTSLNGLLSYGNMPIRASIGIGLTISFLSILYAFMQLVLALIFRESAAPGISTIIVSLFFIGGVQLFFLGLIGEYVVAIHSQVRKGPLVIESQRINFVEEKA